MHCETTFSPGCRRIFVPKRVVMLYVQKPFLMNSMFFAGNVSFLMLYLLCNVCDIVHVIIVYEREWRCCCLEKILHFHYCVGTVFCSPCEHSNFDRLPFPEQRNARSFNLDILNQSSVWLGHTQTSEYSIDKQALQWPPNGHNTVEEADLTTSGKEISRKNRG